MLDSVFPSYNRIGLTPRVSSDSNIPQNLQTCPKQFLNYPFVKKKKSEGSIKNLIKINTQKSSIRDRYELNEI